MKIVLRPINENDTERIVKWRNSPNVMNHCMNRTPISKESHLKFYMDNILTGHYKQFIVERVEEEVGVVSYPIATCYLKDIDKTNKRCELCIFTSDDEEWNSESQTIAVKMLLDKAFNEYGMHKVYSYVFYKFMDEAKLLKRAGFTSECILKNEVISDDETYDDVIRFVIFKE